LLIRLKRHVPYLQGNTFFFKRHIGFVPRLPRSPSVNYLYAKVIYKTCSPSYLATKQHRISASTITVNCCVHKLALRSTNGYALTQTKSEFLNPAFIIRNGWSFNSAWGLNHFYTTKSITRTSFIL